MSTLTTVARERCKHQMITVMCAICSPRRAAKEPVKRKVATAHGEAGASAASLQALGIVVLHTHGGRTHCMMDHLNESTVLVHISGSPFLWAFEEILRRAPNVKTIQVIPSAYAKLLPDSHLRLCAARGVNVALGHIRPELAWEEPRIVSPQYHLQRKFMLGLSGEQRQLFDELVQLGFESASIAARYFCLGGEEYMPQRLVAAEYGIPGGRNSSVSEKVLGVLHYLDDTIEVGEGAKQVSRAMRQAVIRLRPYLASAERRMQLEKELGVTLPSNFPLSRVEVFRRLLEDMRSGRLRKVLLAYPKDLLVLTKRFGLDGLPTPAYRTLVAIGEVLGGITRERVRQLEERALALLEIVEE